MDPVVIFDPVKHLSSIWGIVVLTIPIVHGLKRSVGTVPVLRDFPVWLYAMLVAGALTWLAHDVLGTLEGELPMLLTSAVGSALMSSGAIELFRTWNKPIAETTAAREAQLAKELYVRRRRRHNDADDGF